MPGGSSPSRAPATPAAQAALDRYCRRLASALAVVINIVDPDVVVLGGGLSQIDELYPALPPLLAEYVFSDRCDTPVVQQPARRRLRRARRGLALAGGGKRDSTALARPMRLAESASARVPRDAATPLKESP